LSLKEKCTSYCIVELNLPLDGFQTYVMVAFSSRSRPRRTGDDFENCHRCKPTDTEINDLVYMESWQNGQIKRHHLRCKDLAPGIGVQMSSRVNSTYSHYGLSTRTGCESFSDGVEDAFFPSETASGKCVQCRY
jgi:hypothetical protein